MEGGIQDACWIRGVETVEVCLRVRKRYGVPNDIFQSSDKILRCLPASVIEK